MWATCGYQSHNHTLPADCENTSLYWNQACCVSTKTINQKQKGGGSLLKIDMSRNSGSNKVVKEGALKNFAVDEGQCIQAALHRTLLLNTLFSSGDTDALIKLDLRIAEDTAVAFKRKWVLV